MARVVPIVIDIQERHFYPPPTSLEARNREAIRTITLDVELLVGRGFASMSLSQVLKDLILLDSICEGVAAVRQLPGERLLRVFEAFKLFLESLKERYRGPWPHYYGTHLQSASDNLEVHGLEKFLRHVIDFLRRFQVPSGECIDIHDLQNHTLITKIFSNLVDAFELATKTLGGYYEEEEKEDSSLMFVPYTSDLLYRDLDAETQWACVETDENVQNRMDDYQEDLDAWPPEDDEGRRNCLREMMRLAKERGIFPRSMYCHGVRVDDWELRGEGGFAHVYRGTFNGDVVAVKVLKQAIGNVVMQGELWKRCAKEALLWRQLVHPNVVQCYGVTNDVQIERRWPLCLVFPWITNGDLQQYIHDKVPFDDGDMFPLNALEDIACGLEYLHSHNPPIVHADIRCANILVKADLSCCISDLGLSFPTEFTLTSHGGDVPGTVRFMAPEVLLPSDEEHRKDYDTPARDVYSFGCLMVEIYTAQEPFSWLYNSGQITMALCVKRSKPWKTRPLGIAEALWSLALLCWNENPLERPSMNELYHNLLRQM